MDKQKSANAVALFLIFLVFLDTMGVAIVIIQIMPRLVKLGASPLLSGVICSLYGAVQLFSCPIVGGISDKSDRKTILIGSILLSATSYSILGNSSLWIFTLSRFLSGLFKHTHSTSITCISDLVSEKEKGKYFGYFGAGIGAGFVIGPVIGGFLAQRPDGFQLMSMVTTSIFLLNALLVWKFLPGMKRKTTDSKDTNKKQNKLSKESKKGGVVLQYLEHFGIESCWDVFVLQALLEAGMMISFSNIGLVAEDDYGFESKDVGMFIGALSLIGVITSALGSKISACFDGDRMVTFMLGVTFVTYVILSLRPSLYVYTASMLVMCVSTTLLRNGWPEMVTSRSAPEKSGKVIGFLHSIVAVAGMTAPLLGGIATQLSGSFHSTTLLTTLFVLASFIACKWFPRPMPKRKTN